MAGKKYDYFDEQNDQAKQNLDQIREQMEQMAKDQAKDALKRYRQMSQKAADMAGESASEGAGTGTTTGAAAGSAGMTAGAGAGEGSGAAVGSVGMTAAEGSGAGSGAAVGTAGMTSNVGAGAGVGATVGGSAAEMTAVSGAGAGVGSAGAGAASGGIAVGWKVILIILIVLIVIVILYFLISAVLKLDKQLQDVDPNTVDLDYIPDAKKVYNNAEYVLGLIENGYISLETSEVGAFDNDYAKPILRAVADEAEARGEYIDVSYEGKAWVLVEDANGKTIDDLEKEIKKNGGDVPDYYVDDKGATFTNKYGKWQESTMKNLKVHTKLSRKDIESTSFQNDYFADPYELRWQPVYVLCAMKVAEKAGDWGLSEKDADGNPKQLTVEQMNQDGVGDYFLKDADIQECIDCFMPKFRYIWNPLEKGMDGKEFTYDDDEMKVYLVKDNRETNTALGQREYVFHTPVVAASYVDLGYRKIRYIPEVVNGESVISYRIIEETPEEWVQKLNQAAGGYFDQDRFLYLLGQLPDTDDLVEEYRKIFEATDSTYEDRTVTGCIGGHIREAKVNAGGTVTWIVDYDIDPTKEVELLLHLDPNHGRKFSFKKYPAEVDTFKLVVNGYAYARPLIIQSEAERMSKEQIEKYVATWRNGNFSDCADAFYKVQQTYNVSVPALMALYAQEGADNIPTGKDGWNYGNEKATAEDIANGYTVSYADSLWVNYKLKYANVDYAAEGFDSLHGYCTYKGLQSIASGWMTKRSSLADISLRARVGNTVGPMPIGEVVDCSTQVHNLNYCPPCDDNGFLGDGGVTEEGYGLLTGGWVNRIESIREQIERSYGYDIHDDDW